MAYTSPFFRSSVSNLQNSKSPFLRSTMSGYKASRKHTPFRNPLYDAVNLKPVNQTRPQPGRRPQPGPRPQPRPRPQPSPNPRPRPKPQAKPKPGPPGDTASRIAREQYRDWLERFRPREKAYANRLTSEKLFGQQVARAGNTVAQSYNIAGATADRDLARYGIDLDPTEQASMNRMQRFGEAKDRSAAMNTARATLGDMRVEGLSNMTGFGRNLAASAGSVAGQAAGMAGVRQNANNQIAAQNAAAQAQYGAQRQSNMLGGVAQGAAMGAMVGGVPGAVIGGAAGLILGVF